MARDIPKDRPLSDEDRKYLMDRGREGEIARLDEEFGIEEDAEEETEEVDYSGWTVAELQSEIDRRNNTGEADPPLARDGKKADLIARLEEHDATAATPE